MADLSSAVPWTLVWEQDFSDADALDAAVVHRFTLPQVSIFASFRVLVPTFTAGSLDLVSLRFGFGDADADAATEGMDFGPLAAAFASSYKTTVYSVGASAPDVEGNALAILPPRCSIRTTTSGGTITFAYQVFASYLVLT